MKNVINPPLIVSQIIKIKDIKQIHKNNIIMKAHKNGLNAMQEHKTIKESIVSKIDAHEINIQNIINNKIVI